MKLSVVVPAYNEEENLPALADEITAALAQYPSFEVIYVNDGSTDSTQKVMEGLAAADNRVVAINLESNHGQSYATMKGIERATGDYVVIMDADRQNDPADITMLIGKLTDDLGGVCGWRRNRKDKRVFVVSSIIANILIRFMFGLNVHDSGCSLRVIRAKHLREIHYFKNFHRYIPILLHLNKVALAECEVNHRWREKGQSSYSILKSIRVVQELIYIKYRYKKVTT